MDEQRTRRKTRRSDIISFYRSQIARFEAIGIGGKTEFNTKVTETLMNATRRRLLELQQKRWKLLGDINGAD